MQAYAWPLTLAPASLPPQARPRRPCRWCWRGCHRVTARGPSPPAAHWSGCHPPWNLQRSQAAAQGQPTRSAAAVQQLRAGAMQSLLWCCCWQEGRQCTDAAHSGSCYASYAVPCACAAAPHCQPTARWLTRALASERLCSRCLCCCRLCQHDRSVGVAVHLRMRAAFVCNHCALAISLHPRKGLYGCSQLYQAVAWGLPAACSAHPPP